MLVLYGTMVPRIVSLSDALCDVLAELADIMSRYGDYDELKEAWHVWHDTVGIPERKPFIEYIKLANESAVAKGNCPPSRFLRACTLSHESPL